MKNLNYDSGYVTYKVNGDNEITFHPTDSSFIERLFTTFESLEKKQNVYEKEIAALSEPQDIFNYTRALDKEMRDAIDSIFSSPVSDVVFPPVNVYSMADGLPVWCNFILAVIDEVNAKMIASGKGTNERIKKYTDKYKRK